MKAYKYKILAIVLIFTISLKAQTYDKKINENFKVNSDVELVVNTINTDVTIEAWNKNEVEIIAVMEVEGANEVTAKKILKNWDFEALGNKSTVKITSLSENFNYNFDFNFDFPEIEIPDIEIPEFDIVMPEMPEFPEMPDFEEIEFDFEAYKKDSTYLKKYKMQVEKQVEKFNKSDWKQKMDSIRNTKEYKHVKEEMEKASKEIAVQMKEWKNSEEYLQALEASKKAAEQARKEILENKDFIEAQTKIAKESAKKAMEMVQEMREKGLFDSIQNFSENIFYNINNGENSSVKIKKYIQIKVPKNATFDLNVRDGNLKIPDSNKKISATVSYGNFTGGSIAGNNNQLTISNSPTAINSLNATNVTLKNVPNAMFGTFSNGNIFSNYSTIIINNMGENVSLSNKFGDVEIAATETMFKNLNLILDYAKATINLSEAAYEYQITNKKSKLTLPNTFYTLSDENKDGVQLIRGYEKNKNSANKLFLTSVYSTLVLN